MKEERLEENSLQHMNVDVAKDLIFEVYERLEKKDNYYLMYEYTREKKLLQIGVKESKASSVIVEMEEGQVLIELKRSDQQADFWYEPTNAWKDGWYATRQEAIFGMNAAGNAVVRSYDPQGELLDRKEVLILPRTFSYEQYEMMKMEVQYYLENIAASTLSMNRDGKLNGIQIPLYSLEKMKAFIDRFVDYVQMIVNNPAERLIQKKRKVSQMKIKKWNSRLLIERSLKGPHQKLSTAIVEKDFRLVEHQMIKQFLCEIQAKISQETILEQSILLQLQKELELRQEKLNHYAPGNLGDHMVNRVKGTKRNITLLQGRLDEWTHIKKEINQLLEVPLFSVEEIPFTTTHLFIHNPLYRNVLELYEEWSQLTPTLKRLERNFIDDVLSSPNLYQLWVLIQVIYELNKYGYYAEENVWTSLLECYEKEQDIKDWRHLFMSKNRGKILLGYELSVWNRVKGEMRPDYLLAYQAEGEKKWKLHILDAKYKPYSKMKNGEKLLEGDLERSARRYVNEIHLNDGVENTSAALVHTDPTIHHWHVDKEYLYQTSHFHLLPGDLEGVKTYMKRLFHYFHEQDDLCPTCGEETVSLEGKEGWKQTYICPHDDEVWVKSTCNYCGNTPRIQLFKYASDNYNEQVDQQWNVHCPQCSKEYKGSEVELDIFGGRIGN